MGFSDFAWLDHAFELLALLLTACRAAGNSLWNLALYLQEQYPQIFSLQTLFGLAGTALAIWKWWEGREVNLFRRFERMIERQEAQLIKARSDLLDLMVRPGPGLLIRPPLFAEKALRHVLLRRRWHSAFASTSFAASIGKQ